jgi:hypothetical protein
MVINVVCNLTEEQIKICKFLPVKYKQKLLELATIDDLTNEEVGYSKTGAYKAKEKGVISDERCEKLIVILGEKARPILIEALREFASNLNCQVNC